MKASHLLQASPRTRLGSRYAKRERTAGRLPAVVYGHGQNPVAVSLEAVQTLRYIQAGEKVFSLSIDGRSQETVILKDVQFDYLGTNIVHVDLARVDLNEVIETTIAVRLVGEAVGMKKAGNILTHPTPVLSVRCTVSNLVDHVDVNITDLEVGQSIHARDVKLPQGITLAGDEDAIVAAINIIKVQEETAGTEAGAVDAAAAGPEVITAKKEKEGEDDKKGGGKDKG